MRSRSIFVIALGALALAPAARWALAPAPDGGIALAAADSIFESHRNAIVEAAERVGPAVVAVHTYGTQVVQGSPGPFGDPFFRGFFAPRYYERPVTGLGSGVIIDERGYVVTNDHVVQGAEKIHVKLPDGRELSTTLVGTDPSSDLALLRIDDPPAELPQVEFADSDRLLIGEWAIAIGNPFGDLIDDPRPTVTAGVVSALHRDVKSDVQSERVYRDMIQTDASINPGNSGGALVNGAGELIGVNTFIFSSGGGSLGIGFAIPSNRVHKVIRDLAAHGEVRPVWMGVLVQELSEELASALSMEKAEGVLVADVVGKSPGDRAGLRDGDLIVELGDEAIRNALDFELALAQAVVGEELDLRYLRGRESMRTTITLAQRPADLDEREIAALGMRGRDLTDSLARRHGVRGRRGVLITTLDPNGALARSGIEVGDVIRGFGRWEIRSAEELAHVVERVRRGNPVLITFERQGRMFHRRFVVR